MSPSQQLENLEKVPQGRSRGAKPGCYESNGADLSNVLWHLTKQTISCPKENAKIWRVTRELLGLSPGATPVEFDERVWIPLNFNRLRCDMSSLALNV